MTPVFVLAALVACSAAATIHAAERGPAGLRRVFVFKPLTTLLIVVLAVLADAPDRGYRGLIVLGLAFSLGGDVFLMLPRDRFVAGLASFLVAHITYLVAFARGVPAGASTLPVVAYLAIGGGVLALLWYGIAPALRLPVAAYVAVISVMAGEALARWMYLETAAAGRAALGALLFVASDSVLAVNRFRRPVPRAQTAILGTYWAAQFLIAWSVVGQPA